MDPNEAANNNLDFTAIIEELQTLNEGTVSNGEKLDQVIEYLIAQDELKQKKEKDQEKKSTEEAEQAEIKSQEKEQQEQLQDETYTMLLTDLRDQTTLSNYLISGQIYFEGVIFGTLLLTVLWNRFIR